MRVYPISHIALHPILHLDGEDLPCVQAEVLRDNRGQNQQAHGPKRHQRLGLPQPVPCHPFDQALCVVAATVRQERTHPEQRAEERDEEE